MAEDTVDQAIELEGLPAEPCRTESLKIHGYCTDRNEDNAWGFYGSDAEAIDRLKRDDPELGRPLHPDFPFSAVEVLWAVRKEMARTVDDVLARRLRILFLNAKVAMELAPKVASIIAKELNRDRNWENQQVKEFHGIAIHYLVDPEFEPKPAPSPRTIPVGRSKSKPKIK